MHIVIPTATSIGIFSIAAILLLLTPGPAVLYIVARSVEQGRIAGLASACGITTGTLVHVLAAALGLSALLASSALAFSIVKYAGAGYLIYIGSRRILSRTGTLATKLDVPRRSLGRLYRDGFVINLLNPKTALFFLAFLPQFVDASRGAVAFQIVFLGLTFTLMGLTSDGLYALLAGTAGGWVKRNQHYLRWERFVTGGLFIGLGVTAAFAGNGGRK
jgi:threonine/homoserine/homoserine lactone efflux protein